MSSGKHFHNVLCLSEAKGMDIIMKKIIILRGNSGSGKTTVARALQKKFGYNTMMISQDEIRRNILWVKDGVDTKACLLYTSDAADEL